MNSLPYSVSQRITKEVTDRYQGKPHAEIKIPVAINERTREAILAIVYIEEINCLWSVVSEYILANQDEKIAPHPSSFVQYIRALEFKEKREPKKAERVR